MPHSTKTTTAPLVTALLTLFTLIGSSTTGLAQGKLSLQDFLRSGPEERLVDQDGDRITSDRMADRVVAVTFFSTDCSILCVGRLRDLAATVSGLPAAERSRVEILALTVDPTRDAPDALKGFSDGMKLDPAAVTLAAGEPDGTAAMLASIGWRPAGDGPDRAPPTVFVFDRRGAFAMRYGGVPLDRQRLQRDLATLADLDGGVGQGVARVSTLR